MHERIAIPSLPWFRACCLAAGLPACAISAQDNLTPEIRQKIETAVPGAAPAVPSRPHRLLLYDVNVVYGGHPSRFAANHAFARMGQRTGAFEATLGHAPAVFERESLGKFDAVFFNNTVGNLFEDPRLRRNLADFVYGGGGLLGLHGTSVAFTRWPGAHEDWPEFARMLGARGAAHQAADERIWIRNEEAGHPLNRGFDPGGFERADEFFRFTSAYSRDRVRVLLSIDTQRSAKLQGVERLRAFRPDDDYALAWVRNYGRGRAPTITTTTGSTASGRGPGPAPTRRSATARPPWDTWLPSPSSWAGPCAGIQ